MKEVMSLLKVMADETRLRILFLLFQDECCVCEISGVLDIPQPRISQSLAKLRSLNLVKDRRQDKYMYYQLNKEHVLLQNLLKELLNQAANDPRLRQDQENFKNKNQYGLVCCGPKKYS